MTRDDSSKVLRDFIYLDKNRMYSLYSQLFEGVAESMVRSITYGVQDAKTEKKLEETIIDASTKVQNVILFDHIYNSLEEKMRPNILIVGPATRITDIRPDSFIKVTGYARVEDYDRLLYLLSNFNEIGTAFATLTLKSQGVEASKNAVDKYAKENNLYLDKKHTDSLVKILEEVHGKGMEIVIPVTTDSFEAEFRTFVEDEFLRLPQSSIKNIYGYSPCMKWTVVGEATNLSYVNTNTAKNGKGIMTGLFDSLESINTAFSGLTGAGKTVRIAPIAIYVEHILSADNQKSEEETNATHEI